MSLSGVYSFTLDQKGRVVVPFPWRPILGSPLILTRDRETLLLASLDTWERLHGRISDEARTWAVETHVDATTGRILLPWAMRRALGLRPGSEVTWAGRGDVVAGRGDWTRWDPPAAPAWASLGERAGRRVQVPRGTLLITLGLLTGVEGADAVRDELARCCDAA